MAPNLVASVDVCRCALLTWLLAAGVVIFGVCSLRVVIFDLVVIATDVADVGLVTFGCQCRGGAMSSSANAL